MTEPKKLIEVAMPVKEVSAESVRDKSIRHGHISTLHLWWAGGHCRFAVQWCLPVWFPTRWMLTARHRLNKPWPNFWPARSTNLTTIFHILPPSTRWKTICVTGCSCLLANSPMNMWPTKRQAKLRLQKNSSPMAPLLNGKIKTTPKSLASPVNSYSLPTTL